MSNRDDFSKQTIETLAKRVAFICSNPSCNAHTIGPNDMPDKHSNIGIAAHISAASPGGPRFDCNISSDERKDIKNGIWLCSNCAKLIDSDSSSYSTELLMEWKLTAENRQRNIIAKPQAAEKIKETFLDIDLVWNGGGRFIEGYSTKNPARQENGITYYDISGTPIAFYKLEWKYKLVIINNSEMPAYNLFTEYLSDIRFKELTKLPSVNNLPPFESVNLDARFTYLIEDNYRNADKIFSHRIPSVLNNLRLRIGYLDQNRNGKSRIICINDGKVIYE